MKQLTEKLGHVEQDVAREKGPLNLFAVFEREDLSASWDLVISASWARPDEATLRYLNDVIKRHLTADQMTLLARIVVLPPNESPVRAITDTIEVEHGRVELVEPGRFGLPVRSGYIITSRSAA